MTEIEETKILLLGLIALEYLGIALCVIGAIILIILLIKKKKIVVPVILIVLGIAAILVYKVESDKVMAEYVALMEKQYDQVALQKAQYAKYDENGNIYYEICQFSLTDNNGNPFTNDTLKDYKYTIVNLWEPWCTFCKQEMPDLVKIYEEYKDQGVNMVGFYNEEEDAQKVIEEYGLTYPVVHLTSDEYKEILTQFSLVGVPLTFVLDSDGRLVDLNLNIDKYANYEPEVSEMYKCLVSGKETYDFWKEKVEMLLEKK